MGRIRTQRRRCAGILSGGLLLGGRGYGDDLAYKEAVALVKLIEYAFHSIVERTFFRLTVVCESDHIALRVVLTVPGANRSDSHSVAEFLTSHLLDTDQSGFCFGSVLNTDDA